MPENVYRVVSLVARYWFALLAALIVLRSFRWLMSERSETRRRLRKLPDAGMVGELVVVEGGDALPVGTALPVPREGCLGFVRGCDITVPCEGVKARHLDFSFENDVGLLIRPRSGRYAAVNGQELNCRSAARKCPMTHGSVLEVGEAVLRLRLFAGVDINRDAMFARGEEETPLPTVTPAQTVTPMPTDIRPENDLYAAAGPAGAGGPYEQYARNDPYGQNTPGGPYTAYDPYGQDTRYEQYTRPEEPGATAARPSRRHRSEVGDLYDYPEEWTARPPRSDDADEAPGSRGTPGRRSRRIASERRRDD